MSSLAAQDGEPIRTLDHLKVELLFQAIWQIPEELRMELA
jgi:hypothetical protein